MATLRHHALVNSSPEAIWEVVSDAPAISGWFPAITDSTGDNRRRTVTLADGSTLQEDIVTCDPELRRFQYRIVGGDLPIDSHLGTIDVIRIDDRRSLVVYSTEIEPSSVAETFSGAIADGVESLSKMSG
ncbi:Polyketide cyclase / dehydrase and lipid transport [Haloechinothrix alba]|uniref:Polyketide cyclase / dehydrase and lipid transport n=1 Tax=Haloechinothrix alba TaxID=664784 RepID=A0A238YXD0_9PSEU|nr:SRPBCC family protein [Haloechinothrix alba]SNR75411.1 Polyketide cyclase / dehydrase and lipid transport [Haloechinothrix alba]